MVRGLAQVPQLLRGGVGLLLGSPRNSFCLTLEPTTTEQSWDGPSALHLWAILSECLGFLWLRDFSSPWSFSSPPFWAKVHLAIVIQGSLLRSPLQNRG